MITVSDHTSLHKVLISVFSYIADEVNTSGYDYVKKKKKKIVEVSNDKIIHKNGPNRRPAVNLSLIPLRLDSVE